TDKQLESQLERLAQAAEAWEELAEIYTAEVKQTNDAERHRRLGQIHLHHLRRTDEAQKHYEALLEQKPDDEEALSTLEQIHTQAQAYPALLAIYRKREGRASEVPRRSEMLFKIAWIEEEQLKDGAAAIGTYKKIVEIAVLPQNRLRALRALEKLYTLRAEHEPLNGVLEAQLAMTPESEPDSRVATLFQLGELNELKLGRAHQALGHYRAAFALMPSHKPTLAALERWIAPEAKVDAGDRVEVAKLLQPIYEQRDDARRLVDVLTILHAATPEG